MKSSKFATIMAYVTIAVGFVVLCYVLALLLVGFTRWIFA